MNLSERNLCHAVHTDKTRVDNTQEPWVTLNDRQSAGMVLPGNSRWTAARRQQHFEDAVKPRTPRLRVQFVGGKDVLELLLRQWLQVTAVDLVGHSGSL